MTQALIGAVGAIGVAVLTWLFKLRDEWLIFGGAERRLKQDLWVAQSVLKAALNGIDESDTTRDVQIPKDQAGALTLATWTSTDEGKKALSERLSSSLIRRIEALHQQLGDVKTQVEQAEGENRGRENAGSLREKLRNVDAALQHIDHEATSRNRSRARKAVIATAPLVALGTAAGFVVDEQNLTGAEVAQAVSRPLADAAVGNKATVLVSDCRKRSELRFDCTVMVTGCDSKKGKQLKGECLTLVESTVDADPDTDAGAYREAKERELQAAQPPPPQSKAKLIKGKLNRRFGLVKRRLLGIQLPGN